MNSWDDSMPEVEASTKLALQNILYIHHLKGNLASIPDEGFMCSEVVISALQAIDGKNSLHLDPVTCPPSTLRYSLLQDGNNFTSLGTLTFPDSNFSEEDKAVFEENMLKKMEVNKKRWQGYLRIKHEEE